MMLAKSLRRVVIEGGAPNYRVQWTATPMRQVAGYRLSLQNDARLHCSRTADLGFGEGIFTKPVMPRSSLVSERALQHSTRFHVQSYSQHCAGSCWSLTHQDERETGCVVQLRAHSSKFAHAMLPQYPEHNLCNLHIEVPT
ncbi:hypothetical protein BaRGS_00003466 [Batillaria attramentaria]|uniref:Uncharacterized protein n=1 Tax=Batillaria attramentaria TaxID=370345 RepID=A0ABD0M0M4_9CAEN